MYIAIETLLRIKQVELIGKKEFVVVNFNLKDEVFVVHIAFINRDLDIYLSIGAQIASFNTDEAPISIPSKYTDFADVCSKNLAAKLIEHTGIYDYTINLIEGH